MSDFHSIFRAVHGELWESGPDQGQALQRLLDALSAEPTPEGIERLSSARMSIGPHLSPQLETGPEDGDVTWLDARRGGFTGDGDRLRL